MDKTRLEAIKTLSKQQVDLERQLVEAKTRADQLQHRLDKLDKEIESLFDGGALPWAQSIDTALDDYRESYG